MYGVTRGLQRRLGVSRVVTSLGWRPHHEQVGQTGSRISPELYVPCGISGAIQHWAGCASSRTIIAVNTDPDAPMVTKADYAVIGDMHEVLPAVTFFRLFWIPVFFMVPLLTMKSLAEERRLGTLETLLTTPVTTTEVVLGKFGAAYVLYLLLWGSTAGFHYVLHYYARDARLLEAGPLVGGYVFIALSGLLFDFSGTIRSGVGDPRRFRRVLRDAEGAREVVARAARRGADAAHLQGHRRHLVRRQRLDDATHQVLVVTLRARRSHDGRTDFLLVASALSCSTSASACL